MLNRNKKNKLKSKLQMKIEEESSVHYKPLSRKQHIESFLHFFSNKKEISSTFWFQFPEQIKKKQNN